MITPARLPFRVLELASPATAPCGRLLAEAGADVIRIAPLGSETSLFHDADKRSVALDLQTADDRSTFARLAATADVLVEAYAPGALAELGLDYDQLRARNPGLVLVSLTPFGQDGPYARYAGGDLVTFAMGGVMFISGEPHQPPVVAPDAQSHVIAGTHGALAALAALWARRTHGRGDWIDVSAFECWVAQEMTIANYHGPTEFARRRGSQHRTSLPGRIFRCRDGFVHLFISREQPVWEHFVTWLGSPLELADPALADINTRWQHADLINRVTAQFLADRGREELFESAQALHLPCVPVNDLDAWLADPHIRQSQPVVTTTATPGGRSPYRTLRSPLRSAHDPPRSAPRADAPSAEICLDLPELPEAGLPSQSPPRSGGPLAGVRVCAFTHVAAGPYATLQLAYLGAEVIKVETRSRPDYWRYRDKNDDPEMSRPFADHNKNTRSATINLRTPEGVALAERLAAASDVVIDNFSAGVLDRLGLGYVALRGLHEKTIAVHMTGLGSSGPRSRFVTFGPSLMAYCGMTALWNLPGQREPVGSQSSYPDFLAGAYAAYAILVALHQRELADTGTLLDLSQAQITAAAMGPSYLAALNDAEGPGPIGNQSLTSAPYGCYPCHGGDDAWCVIAVETDAAWIGLRRLLGEPEWAAAPELATAAGRRAAGDVLDAHVAAWTSQHTPRRVMELCQASGIPAGMVASGADLVNDPHLRERGFLVERTHARLGNLQLPGCPVRFRHASTDIWRFGPLLGEDTDAVLHDVLGLSEAETAQYRTLGALT